ncbi:aa3-type cytochrome oxidase subunit II [Enemella sp. A6]|uniref:aa3-type cytochrome oxidase subunit II n=1 Tax=Enemella sp. A6 TaxID=3440152 RepID=UPI003EBEC209
MGLRGKWTRSRFFALTAAAATPLVLAGCSSDNPEHWFGLPGSATDRAPHMGNLWVGAWIAALAVGVLMWALMFWAVIRYRRRHDDEVPRQTRYHLPLEVFYTLVPFLIIGVLFYFTVLTQNEMNRKEENPDHVIDVVGQKWSWTFNYREGENPDVDVEDVWEAGTVEKVPTLVLPVNESVRFNLSSPDVIHSFWIPAFHYKLDVIPGRANSFDVTPTKEGTFAGKCAELCGTYHSAMIFNVKVVSADEYEKYLQGLAEKGQTGTAHGPQTADVPTNKRAEQAEGN